MFRKFSFTVALAMLGFVFTSDAFAQKEIVIWHAAKNKTVPRTATIKSPRDVATGQVLEQARAVSGDEVKNTPQTNANPRTVRKPKTRNLIDTSTGEIVWAKEAKASYPNTSTARRNRPRQQPFDKGYLPPKAKMPTPKH